MEYNFEAVAGDMLEAFNKKMETNRKAVVKQFSTLLQFMGDRIPTDQRHQLIINIDDILSDGNKSHQALAVQSMHKVIRAVREVTHE